MFCLNLRKYRNQKGLSQEELAEKINSILATNYKKSNIYTWENGTSPKIKTIEAIAEILNIPEQFLFNDSKEVLNKIVSHEEPNLKDMVTNTKRIPLLSGYVGAGSGGIFDKVEVEDYLYIDVSLVHRTYQNKDIKALRVIGDSMIPYVDNQDIVIYSPIEKGKYNFTDGKYIIETINGIMIKNLKFKCNGDIIISSCNDAYSDEIIKATESQEYLDIIGIAVGRLLKD